MKEYLKPNYSSYNSYNDDFFRIFPWKFFYKFIGEQSCIAHNSGTYVDMSYG